MTITRSQTQNDVVLLDARTWRAVAVIAAIATACWAAGSVIQAAVIDGAHGLGDRILLAFGDTTLVVPLITVAVVLAARAAGDARRDGALTFAMLAAALVAFLVCIGAAYAAWRSLTIHVDAGNVNQAVTVSFATQHVTLWERLSGALRSAASFVLASLAVALAWPTLRGAVTND